MTSFTLTFTEQEMQTLNDAIGELPFKRAAPLVQSINRQIMEQQAANEKAGEGK